MLRPLFRSSLPTFAALYFFVACSNESNDFFGGTAGAGTGGSGPLSGSGGSAATMAGGSGGRGPMPGAGSSAGGSSAGGSGNTAGSSGTNAGSSATAGAPMGGTAAIPGAGGADDAGMGGDGGEPIGGTGSAGMPDEVGGTAGGGTAGGGTAGGGATGAGAGSGGSDAGGKAGSGGSTGGGGGKAGTGCEENTDCDDDEYCEKVACADAEGKCAPQPASCVGADATFDPVCGCDQMTYYTPCVAAREGVNVKAAGECTGNDLPTCTRLEGGDSCEPQREGAICYRPRVGCDGVSANTGVCWVLPDACPDEAKVHTYCGGTSGDAECVGLCEVLEREDAVYRDSPGCSE